MQHTAKDWTLWSIGILVVLLYALIPVAWITSLSFKTPDEVADRKFFSGFSFDNYDVVFSDDTFIAALINSIGIAGIATLISIVLAAMAAYATSRLNFTGKALILSGALGTESVSILGYNILINRVNLGLGSAVSILIFICVILIAVLFVKGLGTSTAQQRGET